MDLASLLAACALHGQAPQGAARPAPCPQARDVTAGVPSSLAARLNAPTARDALARVVYAEAGDQGDSGLAGVVYTILNRLLDGRWGDTVEAVVDAPHQFEPVMRAGGSWRGLPAVSAAQEARVNTILNLALQGRLPDLTGGARFFQNRDVVAARASAGQVPQSLVGFGGATPSARIGAHTFYAARGAGLGSVGAARPLSARPTEGDIFFGSNAAPADDPDPLAAPAQGGQGQQANAPAPVHAQTTPGGIFVLPDGTASNAPSR